MKKRNWMTALSLSLVRERVTAPAVAGINPAEEEWTRISEKVNNDAEPGLLTPSKSTSVLEVSSSEPRPMPTNASQDATTADWAIRQVGKPYSLQYWNINRRDKFYCAHLVWAAFRDTAGVDLNTRAYGAAIHPMELVGNPKTAVIYKMRP